MPIPTSTVSSKKQITIPAEVCKKMNLKVKAKILFLEIRPGEFQLVAENQKNSQTDWAKNLAGKYRDDSIDAVQSLLDDRKEDLILEQHGHIQ